MTLTPYGWTPQLQKNFLPFLENEMQPARVIRASRGAVTVATSSDELPCITAGRLHPDGEIGPPVAGDWVALDTRADTAVIRAILPRSGELNRRRAGTAERQQTVAANVSDVLIVESADRGPNRRRIERAVSVVFGGGASPIILLSKCELSTQLDEDLQRAREAAPFSEVIAVSAVRGDGMEELRHRLGPGVTSVLLGPSGAGKSTLVNRLLGEDRLAIGSVRRGDSKGRHTTTSSQLVPLPTGGCLIDTPGVRELGLWLAAEQVDAAFSDIEHVARACRFRDCRHLGEPGCAVRAATETGELDAARLESYHKLRREAEVHELRHDASRRHEQRRTDRSFAKLCRREIKRKGLK